MLYLKNPRLEKLIEKLNPLLPSSSFHSTQDTFANCEINISSRVHSTFPGGVAGATLSGVTELELHHKNLHCAEIHGRASLHMCHSLMVQKLFGKKFMVEHHLPQAALSFCKRQWQDHLHLHCHKHTSCFL